MVAHPEDWLYLSAVSFNRAYLEMSSDAVSASAFFRTRSGDAGGQKCLWF